MGFKSKRHWVYLYSVRCIRRAHNVLTLVCQNLYKQKKNKLNNHLARTALCVALNFLGKGNLIVRCTRSVHQTNFILFDFAGYLCWRKHAVSCVCVLDSGIPLLSALFLLFLISSTATTLHLHLRIIFNECNISLCKSQTVQSRRQWHIVVEFFFFFSSFFESVKKGTHLEFSIIKFFHVHKSHWFGLHWFYLIKTKTKWKRKIYDAISSIIELHGFDQTNALCDWQIRSSNVIWKQGQISFPIFGLWENWVAGASVKNGKEKITKITVFVPHII